VERRSIGHSLTVAIALTALSFSFVAPAAARRAEPTITLSRTVGPPTTHVNVEGTGFEPGEQVGIFFSGRSVATTQANVVGAVLASFHAPKVARPGKHTVKAKGEASGLIAKATFLVRTDWAQFRRDPAHSGTNPYENVLSPKNVAGLTVRWSKYGFGGRDSSPAVVGGVVYINAGEYVDALKASTGEQLWRSTPLGWGTTGTPAVADGTVFASTGIGVDGIDAATGKRIWHFQALGPEPATVSGGLVYFGSYQGGVYAVVAKTGEKRWFASTGPVASSPAVVDGLLYIGSQDHNLYALDASTGARRWTFATGDRVDSSPSVSDGAVYAGSEDGNVYSLDSSTGEKLWSFATKDGLVDSSPAVSGGVVYTGAAGAIYALRASDGKELWESSATINIISTPAVANGVVYIGSILNHESILAALRASTGALLWSYVMSDRDSVDSSPAVVDGLVYVGSPDGYAYAFGL
jgi:outer membrane protein assembly factor BamB